MDYSLLLGIHDIAKAEMDVVLQNESEDDAVEVRLLAFIMISYELQMMYGVGSY